MVIRQPSSAASSQLIGAGAVSLYQLLLRFGSSALAYVGVIFSGGLLAANANAAALEWLWPVMLVLLFVSLRNSWDLLVSVGAATLNDQAGPD